MRVDPPQKIDPDKYDGAQMFEEEVTEPLERVQY